MNIFEVLPANFFSILSSKNKELYADALMLLNKLFQYELNIEVGDFLAALIELLENRAYELEEDDDVTEGGLTLSAKARLILGRFEKTGWIDREYMDGSFTEVITPREYAIQVMKLLHELGETQVREYNSLVFSTYSSLKQAREDHNHVYEAVITAKSNTERLTYELKSLYHSIRGYLRKIHGQSDVNTLLSDHFDEYKALIDRIYHPIKTMDSVYRYMAPIREMLSDILGDAELMDGMRRRAVMVRRYDSEEDAGREILYDIDYVLDVYASIGGIIDEIGRKHSLYTKLSIDTIRYHMNADQTIGGKLSELLKAYASATDVDQEAVLELMTRGVRINRQDFIDGGSLWHRNVKSRRISAEPLAISADNGLSGSESEHISRLLVNDYSLKKIVGYMNRLFQDKRTISADDIEIHGDDEFILLFLAAIRAGERSTGFTAQPGTGSRNINGYVIPEIYFTRKGAGSNVE